MTTNFLFSLVPFSRPDHAGSKPEPKPSIEMQRVIRVGGKGAEWDSPGCQEINSICDELGLTAVQICQELYEFDGVLINRESLQSYKQGNVLGQERYALLLARLRPFLQMRRAKYGRLMKLSAVEIIEGWMKRLRVDIKSTVRSPWKEFSARIGEVNRNGKMITIDSSTLYRWYQNNKKPASINDLIWYDQIVSDACKNSR